MARVKAYVAKHPASTGPRSRERPRPVRGWRPAAAPPPPRGPRRRRHRLGAEGAVASLMLASVDLLQRGRAHVSAEGVLKLTNPAPARVSFNGAALT